MYRRRQPIVIVADRDPLALVAESRSDPDTKPSAEWNRWAQLLRTFRKETAGIGDERPSRTLGLPAPARGRLAGTEWGRTILDECSVAPPLVAIAEDLAPRMPADAFLTAEDARREFSEAAQPYYRALWSSCSTAEKLALHQLAEETLVNPQSQAVVGHLIRAGLVRRDPDLAVMNETFRRFIVRAPTSDQVAGWETAGVQLPWASIETALVTVVAGLAVLLVLTQEQLLSAWTGFVPALAPAVPTVLKFLGSVQRGTKKEIIA